MRAITYRAPHALRVERVPDPVLLAPTDALVRVRLAAICGSDLHVWHGRETGLDPGTVMGHEFLGEVVDKGAEVSRVRVGDLAVSPFTTSCGACFYCRQGLTARCARGQLFGWVERGAGLHGAQAELVRVPLAETTLLPLPPGLAPEAGLLLGDVLSTGHHAAVMAGGGARAPDGGPWPRSSAPARSGSWRCSPPASSAPSRSSPSIPSQTGSSSPRGSERGPAPSSGATPEPPSRGPTAS